MIFRFYSHTYINECSSPVTVGFGCSQRRWLQPQWAPILVCWCSLRTSWHFVNPAQAQLQSLLPCRALFCPRKDKPWAELLSDTSKGWMCSSSYSPQNGSSQGHRIPCPPPPMKTEHDKLVQNGAWNPQYRRSFSALSTDEDGLCQLALSFHRW